MVPTGDHSMVTAKVLHVPIWLTVGGHARDLLRMTNLPQDRDWARDMRDKRPHRPG